MNTINNTTQALVKPAQNWFPSLSKSQMRWGYVFSAVVIAGLLALLIRKVIQVVSAQHAPRPLETPPPPPGPLPIPSPAAPDAPAIYTKGVHKTPAEVKTDRKQIGVGKSGAVFGHNQDEGRVVKKSPLPMANEYKIGKRLDHPRFVKMHHYYVKELPEERKKHKLAMDRIQGNQITTYYSRNENKLTLEQLKQCVNQAEQACLHLFEKGVYWVDVNNDNMIVSSDLTQLTFLDYDKWVCEDDPRNRARQLLLGSMECMGWLVKSSVIRTPQRDENKEKSVMYPKEFFGVQILERQIITFPPQFHYDSWMNRFTEQLNSTPPEKYPELLSGYFNAVRAKIAELENS